MERQERHDKHAEPRVATLATNYGSTPVWAWIYHDAGRAYPVRVRAWAAVDRGGRAFGAALVENERGLVEAETLPGFLGISSQEVRFNPFGAKAKLLHDRLLKRRSEAAQATPADA